MTFGWLTPQSYLGFRSRKKLSGQAMLAHLWAGRRCPKPCPGRSSCSGDSLRYFVLPLMLPARSPRVQRVKWLVQHHATAKWKSWDLTQFFADLNTNLFFFFCPSSLILNQTQSCQLSAGKTHKGWWVGLLTVFLFVCLFEREKNQKSDIWWFTSQRPAAAEAGLGQNQVSECPFESPIRLVGIQGLELSPVTFQGMR